MSSRDIYERYGLPMPYPEGLRLYAFFEGKDAETGSTFWDRDLSKCTGCAKFRRGVIPGCTHLAGGEYASAMRRPGGYCGTHAEHFTPSTWRWVVFWLLDQRRKQTRTTPTKG